MADPVVYLVDDDPSVRHSVARLIRSSGVEVSSFASAHEFLAATPVDRPACLLLDIQMPGLSGLDLQEELATAGLSIPIVFLTGHGTIPMSVQAMREGAVDFLTKPVQDKTLLAAVERGLEQAREGWRGRAERLEIRRRLASLTPREREVLTLVVAGRLNKQIGYELRITEKTVKVHRGRVMQKMQARSLPHLVRLAEKAGVAALEP